MKTICSYTLTTKNKWNKNNANVQYLLRRVMTGKHRTVELSFMLVGHTKFAPRSFFFGLIKKRYRRFSVNTITDIARVLKESTMTGCNHYQLIRDLDGTKLVEFYEWTQVCRCSARWSNEYPNSEEITINILRLKVSHQILPTARMPELTQVKGLDDKRQWYLYEQIRVFCKTNLAADFTYMPKTMCSETKYHFRYDNYPEPSEQQTTGLHESASTTVKKGTKRKCSICKQFGP